MVAKLKIGSVELAKETHKRLDFLARGLADTPAAPAALFARAKELDQQLKDLEVALNGDKVLAKYQQPVPETITDRVQRIVDSMWYSTSAPTGTLTLEYDFAAQEFAPILARLKTLVESDLKDLESKVEAAGAPWTPGRVPAWKKE